ncbi:MAG TPA: AAA family ATPase, partial [Bryobacteraceae bacterium]|nr:AAA family ATPase [Bryobacteraceae bacterium]
SLAGVLHPNLVGLHELFHENGAWFFTMEYIEGTDFIGALKKSSSPTSLEIHDAFDQTSTIAPDADWEPADAEGFQQNEWITDYDQFRLLLRQLAEGLSALHSSGILHRDLKPLNVLVTPEERVVILDFGLAQEIGGEGFEQATAGVLAGTIRYMSPEQAAGDTLTEASDWYSVGVIMYQALTGQFPHQGMVGEVLHAKKTTDPPLPSSICPLIPPDLEALCMRLLSRDPQQRPSGEQVITRLGAMPARVAGKPVSHVFAGREQAVERLSQGYERMRRGKAAVMSLSGPSGVGKSTLLGHFLHDLHRREDAVILSGRCYERESVPFKALDNLVDGLSRYLRHLPGKEVAALMPREAWRVSTLFPVLNRVNEIQTAPARSADSDDRMASRRRAAAAFRELLARLSDRHPLVLAIDDMQWGDIDSANLLGEILKPPDEPALLLVVSYRSEYAGSSPGLLGFLSGMADNAIGVEEIPVEPLDAEQSRRLVRQLAGGAADATIDAIVREAGGNPYFLSELSRQALSRETGPSGGASGLDDLIWSNAAGMSAEARQLLWAIALSGRPLQLRHAYQAAGLERMNPAAILTLLQSRFVRTAGSALTDEVETYHDHIRETVVARLDHQTAVECHYRIATTLEDWGNADPEALAVHFDQAGKRERAAPYYKTAGAQALRTFAFLRAARLLERALDAPQWSPAELNEILASLAEAQAGAGYFEKAARTNLRAAAIAADGITRQGLKRTAASQFCIGGYLDEGYEAFQEVLKAAGLGFPRPLSAFTRRLVLTIRLRLRGIRHQPQAQKDVRPEVLDRLDTCLAVGIAVSSSIVEPMTSGYFSAKALLMALQAGEPRRLIEALCLEAVLLGAMSTRFEPMARNYLAEAERLAKHFNHPALTGLVGCAQGILAYVLGRYQQSVQQLGEILQKAGGVAHAPFEVIPSYFWSLLSIGEYRELGRIAPAYFKEAQERGDRVAAVNIGQHPYTMALLAADRPSEGDALLKECRQLWRTSGYHFQNAQQCISECWCDMYRGDAMAAWKRVEEHWPQMKENYYHVMENLAVYVRAVHGLAALTLGRECEGSQSRDYLRAAERDAAFLSKRSLRHGPAMGMVIRAEIARFRGDDQRAVRELERAVDLFDSVHMNALANSSRRRLGQILGSTRGQELVQTAEDWMREHGVADPEKMTCFHAGPL